jgi:hypothetical protein
MWQIVIFSPSKKPLFAAKLSAARKKGRKSRVEKKTLCVFFNG